MRGVLDIFHKQTTSERGVKEREKLSRRALLGAAAAAAAVTAVTAVTAAALLGNHSAPETSVAAGLVSPVGASDPPVKAVGDGAVHDVDRDLGVRGDALCTRENVYSKLKQFPALVTLLPKTGDLLLNGAMQIEGTAAHLDVEQTAWILIALLARVCTGSNDSGAAYARVVARGRVLGLTDAADLDVSLLKSLGAVKEYVAAISADLVTFDRVLAIASALVTTVKREHPAYASTPLAYAPIIETDLSLAAIARRCTEPHKSPRTQEAISEFVASLAQMGELLPETMGVVVSSHSKYIGAMKDEPPEPHVCLTLMHARFIVAAMLRERRGFVFTADMITGLRKECRQMMLASIQQSALVVDTIVFLANLAPGEGDDGDLLSFLNTSFEDKSLSAGDLLALWERHALVRAVVPKSPAVLTKFLIAAYGWNLIDEVIDHDDIAESVIEGVKRRMTVWPDNASAIERMGVRALEPFLDTIESVVLSGVKHTIAMVQYYAALGRSGRRATHGANINMDVLRKAWEQAPNSVLDAARYWNVSGKPLFDLLCAGAKWGRYEQISKMTNLFGDWTPDSASFVDVHARIVGAFFGLCERGEASDGDLTARCWHCSESGTHDDAMVALVFRRKASAYSIATAVKEARSRGRSGIHGFLLVPGNGPTEPSEGPKRWSNSPIALHAEKVKLVGETSSVEPADVVRAVRMAPWLVTFVDPTSAIPMLMALITLVPECAAFLDPAQRGALEIRSLFSSENLDDHLHASRAIVGSVSAVDDVEVWNARVHAALAELHALTSGNVLDRPDASHWPEGGEDDKEVVLGEADIRRMLSSAYADQNRGVRDIEALIRTHVIDPLRRHSETSSRLFGLATALISEYNVLLRSRKIDAWAVPVMAVDTPRPLAFGKRRFV